MEVIQFLKVITKKKRKKWKTKTLLPFRVGHRAAKPPE